MRAALGVVCLLAATATGAAAQSIQGVWKAVEVDVDSGPQKGRHTTDVQPSLFIFTRDHYSMMYIPAFTARPVLSDSATSEQRLDVLDRFVANAGSYTLTDSTVTLTPSVAKNPGVMSGRTFKWTVHVAGDSLRIGSALHLARVE